ncbi:putative catechol oxidase [Dioscorea sansibarensis]
MNLHQYKMHINLGNLISIIICLYNVSGVAAMPIGAPDLSRCQPFSAATNCCLINSRSIVDFKLPSTGALRVRPAAHLVNVEYILKYANATRLMRSLPVNHPWNFIQQANVHCAYCEGIYNLSNFPNMTLQVHSSWLFLPFHRMYLYFHEKILGKLIGDESFALPFWNWDSPGGMGIPIMYTDPNSSLFDNSRAQDHQPPSILNYGFSNGGSNNISSQIEGNLELMYNQMVSGAKTVELLLGGPYRAGDDEHSSPGTVEVAPHPDVHIWTGIDMSSFVTAGRDPIFYSHHSNVDRMWEVWKALPGNNSTGVNYINDTDWLDSSFLFWDENLQLVRIKVRDVLDTTKLGYVYQQVPIPWSNKTAAKLIRDGGKMSGLRLVELPVVLDSAVKINVELPKMKMNMKTKTKMNMEEVLVVDGIEFDARVHVGFDVFVGGLRTSKIGFAGRFKHLAVKKWRKDVPMGGLLMKKRLVLGLKDLVEELRLERGGLLVVTLIPSHGTGMLKVGSVPSSYVIVGVN